MDLPGMMRIRQEVEAPVLDDIEKDIQTRIESLHLDAWVKAGDTVAVGCSSRGIANYAVIVKSVVDALLNLKLIPFLFPAMGSHGSASPQGQKAVLESYGISEATMGVPIKSSLEVVQVGETEDRIPVFIDRSASQAKHIVLINRVKMHTEFDFEIESGLMKMMAIGLGKKKGATVYHQGIMVHGYPKVIQSVARQVLKRRKILFGVGIVENALSQTSRIGVFTADELEDGEKALLAEAKRLAIGLPFDEADVLIIDEMGKDISGTGFDTKVVGRILMPLVAEEPESPRVKRIVVCSLTERTGGNADGVGIADFVTRRLVDNIDQTALYVNAIAGAEPEHAKIPLTLRNDREAVEVAIGSVGLIPRDQLRIMRIRNTLQLGEVAVSEAYAEEVKKRDDLEVIEDVRPIRFDAQGNFK